MHRTPPDSQKEEREHEADHQEHGGTVPDTSTGKQVSREAHRRRAGKTNKLAQPTEFWYAEVEYPTVEAALAWQPESCGLGDYLKDEVTNQPGQSMGEYWVETRG